MALCSNRPEGFGPMSHLYNHIVTSCFLDTILIPLCTWLYLLAIVALLAIFSRRGRIPHARPSKFYMVHGFGSHKKSTDIDVNEESAGGIPHRRHGKTYLVVSVLYYLLLVAQLLMCALEIARLSLAHLGIGLLPFTFISIIAAGALRLTKGMQGRVRGWRWANLALWVALTILNGVKIAGEAKEGTRMRKGTKYPVVDELTDVSVMIGVYTALGILEVCLRP